MALLIGLVAMSLASLAISATESQEPERRHHIRIWSLMPLIAATSHPAMMLGTGVLTINGVEMLVPARTIDWSCAAFAGVLHMPWRPLRCWSDTYCGTLRTIQKTNATFLTVVWLLHPVEFLLAPQGIGAFGNARDAWASVFLDLVAKVVYGWTVVARFKGLPAEVGERDNTTDAQPSGERARPAT